MLTQQDQMELKFDRQAGSPRATHKPREVNRAQWWFGHMRRVVAMAMEWKPVPPGRPEQVYFTLTAE